MNQEQAVIVKQASIWTKLSPGQQQKLLILIEGWLIKYRQAQLRGQPQRLILVAGGSHEPRR
jgi:hypothetical protein